MNHYSSSIGWTVQTKQCKEWIGFSIKTKEDLKTIEEIKKLLKKQPNELNDKEKKLIAYFKNSTIYIVN